MQLLAKYFEFLKNVVSLKGDNWCMGVVNHIVKEQIVFRDPITFHNTSNCTKNLDFHWPIFKRKTLLGQWKFLLIQQNIFLGVNQRNYAIKNLHIKILHIKMSTNFLSRCLGIYVFWEIVKNYSSSTPS